MTSTEVVVWQKPEVSIYEARAERRERRSYRRFIATCIVAPSVALLGTSAFLYFSAQPPVTAGASQTTQPVGTASFEDAARFTDSMATPTTWPDPDPIPEQVAPGWETYQVRVPGGETLGKLITDGRHAGLDNRVEPGHIGASVLSVDGAVDLSKAQSVVVAGVEWLIFYRGEVNAHDIRPLFKNPVVPQLTLLMETPGDKRPYVEMRIK